MDKFFVIGLWYSYECHILSLCYQNSEQDMGCGLPGRSSEGDGTPGATPRSKIAAEALLALASVPAPFEMVMGFFLQVSALDGVCCCRTLMKVHGLTQADHFLVRWFLFINQRLWAMALHPFASSMCGY